jgi:hypothetical protein
MAVDIAQRPNGKDGCEYGRANRMLIEERNKETGKTLDRHESNIAEIYSELRNMATRGNATLAAALVSAVGVIITLLVTLAGK